MAALDALAALVPADLRACFGRVQPWHDSAQATAAAAVGRTESAKADGSDAVDGSDSPGDAELAEACAALDAWLATGTAAARLAELTAPLSAARLGAGPLCKDERAAEADRAAGNEHFKAGRWQAAMDAYSAAWRAAPGRGRAAAAAAANRAAAGGRLAAVAGARAGPADVKQFERGGLAADAEAARARAEHRQRLMWAAWSDAAAAIEADPSFGRAYLRRGQLRAEILTDERREAAERARQARHAVGTDEAAAAANAASEAFAAAAAEVRSDLQRAAALDNDGCGAEARREDARCAELWGDEWTAAGRWATAPPLAGAEAGGLRLHAPPAPSPPWWSAPDAAAPPSPPHPTLAGAAAGVEVRLTPGAGRGLYAARPFAPGATLLTEPEPLAAAVAKPFRSSRCHTCFRRVPQPAWVPCRGCAGPVYCGGRCRDVAVSGGELDPGSPSEARPVSDASGASVTSAASASSAPALGEHAHECGGAAWPAALPVEVTLALRLHARAAREGHLRARAEWAAAGGAAEASRGGPATAATLADRAAVPFPGYDPRTGRYGPDAAAIEALCTFPPTALPEGELLERALLAAAAVQVVSAGPAGTGLPASLRPAGTGPALSTHRLLALMLRLRANSFAVRDDFAAADEAAAFGGVDAAAAASGAGAFAIGEPRRVGQAVYALASLINHSCRPVAHASFCGRRIIVRAIRPLAPGEQITISYGPEVGAVASAAARRRRLRDTHAFICRCEACSEEEEQEGAAVASGSGSSLVAASGNGDAPAGARVSAPSRGAVRVRLQSLRGILAAAGTLRPQEESELRRAIEQLTQGSTAGAGPAAEHPARTPQPAGGPVRARPGSAVAEAWDTLAMAEVAKGRATEAAQALQAAREALLARGYPPDSLAMAHESIKMLGVLTAAAAEREALCEAMREVTRARPRSDSGSGAHSIGPGAAADLEGPNNSETDDVLDAAAREARAALGIFAAHFGQGSPPEGELRALLRRTGRG